MPWHNDPVRVLRYRLSCCTLGETIQIPPELGGGTITRNVLQNRYNVLGWIITQPHLNTTVRANAYRASIQSDIRQVIKVIQQGAIAS